MSLRRWVGRIRSFELERPPLGYGSERSGCFDASFTAHSALEVHLHEEESRSAISVELTEVPSFLLTVSARVELQCEFLASHVLS